MHVYVGAFNPLITGTRQMPPSCKRHKSSCAPANAGAHEELCLLSVVSSFTSVFFVQISFRIQLLPGVKFVKTWGVKVLIWTCGLAAKRLYYPLCQKIDVHLFSILLQTSYLLKMHLLVGYSLTFSSSHGTCNFLLNLPLQGVITTTRLLCVCGVGALWKMSRPGKDFSALWRICFQ